MKYSFVTSFLFLFLFSIGINAQIAAPQIEWQKSLGGSGADNATCIKQTADGGYIVAGYTRSHDGDVQGRPLASDYDDDYWIVKLSNVGDTVWERNFGGSNTDQPTSIEEAADGGYIVAGTSWSSDGDITGHHTSSDPFYGASDYWIIKLSSNGTMEWQKSLGGSGNDNANSIKQTIDGGYIIAGKSDSNDGDVIVGNPGGHYWIVKLNGNGTIQWQKKLGGLNDLGYEIPYSIEQTTDGGYIIAGTTSSNDGDVHGNHIPAGSVTGFFDYWIVKLDGNGAIQWQKCLGGINGEEAHSIKQTTDGGYIVAGFTHSNDGDVSGLHITPPNLGGPFDYWIVKLNNTGTLVGQKCLGSFGRDDPQSIEQTTDGGYIVVGTAGADGGDVTGFHGTSQTDYWLVKLSGNLELEWQKCLGGSSEDVAHSVQQTSDGGYIMAGYSSSNDGDITGLHGTYNTDYWVVKIGPGSAQCVDNIWVGTVSSNWEDPGNWTCGTLPGATSNVIINAGTIVVLSSDVTIKSLKLKGANFTNNGHITITP